MMTTTQIAGFVGAGLAYVPQISHLIGARCPAGISRLASAGWLAASSSGTPAATGKQQALRVRTPGHRRRRGDRTRAAVGLLHGLEPGRAGHDEFFVQVLVRADRTSQVPGVDQVVGKQLQRVLTTREVAER